MNETRYDYVSPGPVADRFLLSEAFIVGLMGPIGSGKSTAAVMKLMTIAARQPLRKGDDGKMWRRSRFAIIRNSYPELKTTTIKTWHQWIPLSVGSWQGEGPPTHRVKDDLAQLDMEVMFVALDRPEDVRKLLSMELTAAWVNEAREVPKAIIDGLTGRVGRFPAVRDGGCVGPQILLDTNPPDTDHWWYTLAERDTSTPSAKQLLDSMYEAQAALRIANLLGADQPLFEFFRQPGGLSPGAENLRNLDAGYYLRAMAGKTAEWIKVYVHAEYGFVQDGRPVYPEYRDATHCKPFELIRGIPISIGIDFGLTPAATIGQRTFVGQQRVRYELVSEHMGAKRFGEILQRFLQTTVPGFPIEAITGDPAGNAEAQTDESTPFQILATVGIKAKPAPTNDWLVRHESVSQGLTRLIDGEPGWIVHPECHNLRRGMMGAYRYKRVQMVGDERFHDKPDKNMASHVCEAEQYRMLGTGEGRVVLKGAIRQQGGQRADTATM